jgi:hypothetical protein
MNTSSGADSRPLHHVNYFFKLDPLVALVNTLAGHTLSLYPSEEPTLLAAERSC